jgi:hypothetical protein
MRLTSVNVVFTEVRRYTSEAYIRTVWSVRPSLLNPLTEVSNAASIDIQRECAENNAQRVVVE